MIVFGRSSTEKKKRERRTLIYSYHTLAPKWLHDFMMSIASLSFVDYHGEPHFEVKLPSLTAAVWTGVRNVMNVS